VEKAHVHQAKTTWNTTEQDVLAARGGKSQLSIESKLLSYEAILEPIWTYWSSFGAQPPIETWK